MSLAHGRYAECNNKMGVNVSWCGIKAICSCSATLAQFISAPSQCKFIRRQLREEHMQCLQRESHENAFICESKATKKKYDAVQVMHPKTLRACWILAACTSRHNPEMLFRKMMEVVMESWTRLALLQLKVLVYHGDRLSAGHCDQQQLMLLDLKTVLMPRQWFLKKHVDPGMTVKKAICIYKKWHVLNQQPTWGKIPFPPLLHSLFSAWCMSRYASLGFPDLFKRVGPSRLGCHNCICLRTVQVDRGHGMAQAVPTPRGARSDALLG
jgi:hypothetical protein